MNQTGKPGSGEDPLVLTRPVLIRFGTVVPRTVSASYVKRSQIGPLKIVAKLVKDIFT